MNRPVKSRLETQAQAAADALEPETRRRSELESTAFMKPDAGLAAMDFLNSREAEDLRQLQGTLRTIASGDTSEFSANDIVDLIRYGSDKKAKPAVADFVENNLDTLKRAAMTAARRADNNSTPREDLEVQDAPLADVIADELEKLKPPRRRGGGGKGGKRDR